jgi:WD40 repeat protein
MHFAQENSSMLAQLMLLQAVAGAPLEPLPPSTVAVLGQIHEKGGNAFAVLPGEEEVVTIDNGTLVFVTLDGKVRNRVPTFNPRTHETSSSEQAGSVFFSGDHLSLYHMGLMELARYSYPIARDAIPTMIDCKLPKRSDREDWIKSACCTQNNQLFGLNTERKLHLYNESAKKWVPITSHSPPIVDFFSTGGNLVLVGQKAVGQKPKFDVTLYDLDAGKDLDPLRFDPTKQLHDIALSRDGKTIAVLIRDSLIPNFHVEVWDIATREKRKISLDHAVDRVFISRDGKRFACVDIGPYKFGVQNARVPSIEFFDAERGKKLSASAIAGDHLRYGAFIDESKVFVALGDNGLVRKWDSDTGKVAESSAPRGSVSHVACWPDGGYGTFSCDGVYRRWGADFKLQASHPMAPQFGISALNRTAFPVAPPALPAFSPDETRCYALDPDDLRRIVAWDLKTGKRVEGFEFQVGANMPTASAVTPDGNTLGIVLAQRGIKTNNIFSLLDTATGKPLPVGENKKTYQHIEATRMRSMQFASNSHLLTALGSTFDAFNVKTGEREFSVEDKKDGEIAFTIRPDGKEFACSVQSTVRLTESDLGLRDAATGKLLRRLAVPAGVKQSVLRPITAIAYSRDGKKLAAGFESGMVVVYDLDKDTPPKEFTGHKQAVRSIDFALDGKAFITGSDDTSAIVWKISDK